MSAIPARPERLLLASGNAHKRAELAEMLAPLGLTVVAPAEVGGLPDVVEDRPGFAGNAEKKALSAARHTGLWALADDSGLAVDALDGAPGVHSARYAGRHGDDDANNDKVLAELSGVPEESRGASFVCALAVARPTAGGAEPVTVIEGRTRGRILAERRGAGGFGYDPLFLFTEPGHAQTGRCFGELAPAEKGAVSHRGRALRQLVEELGALTGAPAERAR